MEPEIVPSSTPQADPAPPTTPADFKTKKPPKILYLVGGIAIILVVLVLALNFFGKGRNTASNTSSIKSDTKTTTAGKYTNSEYLYEIALPPSWVEIKHSPLLENIALFNVDNTATLEITAAKVISSLDEYLATQDEQNKNSIKSTKTSQVKVGDYDGFERAESWPVVGLQTITTYVKVQDMLYTFALIPASGKNAITSESIIRDYHTALASFRITDTTQLGKDLKEYKSTKVKDLAFKAFSLKYPQTWVLTENIGENSLEVSVYRNNYELTISQKAVGGAVCLFSDSPDFEGSSGDLRNKQYAEFNTGSGAVLRRYFNANAGDKSTMFFCEKQTDGPYFQTPLSIGGLVYYVPAKYDADIIKEMDEIVKSITVITDTPTASPK